MLRLPYLLRLPNKVRRRARRSRMATLAAVAAVILLVAAAPLYVVYKPPAAVIGLLARRWPDVLWRVTLPAGSPPLVALTIDDAPSEHTRDVLDALRAAGAHATFFVIGSQAVGREDVLRDVVSAGHELANHGMRDEPARSLTADALGEQLREVQRIIDDTYAAAAVDRKAAIATTATSTTAEATTTTSTTTTTSPPRMFFRPGSGIFSDRMRHLVADMGYRLALGSIYPHDAQVGYWRLNAAHVLSMLRPGGIVICHDRRSWTAPMLLRVLPEMRRRGYGVVTLSALLDAAEGVPASSSSSSSADGE